MTLVNKTNIGVEASLCHSLVHKPAGLAATKPGARITELGIGVHFNSAPGLP